MEIWKMFFFSKRVIFRFRVSFGGVRVILVSDLTQNLIKTKAVDKANMKAMRDSWKWNHQVVVEEDI